MGVSARTLWKKHGGSQHGPRIETLTMPEANFPAFITELLALRTVTPAWQGMESAVEVPGKRIILVTQQGGVCEGYWGSGRYNRSTKEYEQCWVTSPYSGNVNPTHWQSLPFAPIKDTAK
jgi:hypothetical protein